MAEFERATVPTSAAARPVYLRNQPPFAISSEPMQRALDAWHREQPEAFRRSAEPSASADTASAAERAIALNHLLNYGRLAGERELAALRDVADGNGRLATAPLLQRLEARRSELLSRAPAELRAPLEAELTASTRRLAGKAQAIDAALAGRRQSEALEQSIALGEALLRQDPDQYETLVGDAGAMVDGLGLEEGPRQTLGEAVRKRLAGAALQAQADPVAGEPAAADADLQRGRFRDAFDDDEIKAWRELVAANRARADAGAARREQDAGIVAEIRMLNRLAAAGRAEAPMPAVAEVETVFPGEGAARLTVATRNRQRAIYATEIATQSAEQDRAWIEAATSAEDRAVRVETLEQKRREFARSGGGNLLKLYPALAGAIDSGLQNVGKLDAAIDAYQRQLGRLGVPPEKRALLPTESLQRLADQYDEPDPPHERLVWLDKLLQASGKDRAETIVRAVARARPGFDPNAIRALEALADSKPWMVAIEVLTRSDRDEDYIDGYRVDLRLNPETRKYEDWEVSPQGRERVRPRRFAGAFFEVETRVDPGTGTEYEVEVFPDGSERPRLPADENYPPLRGMALETWLTAAYEQHVNPATWRLAEPAAGAFQRAYREAGWVPQNWYFVGPNGVVYERSEDTAEPGSTQASHVREAFENRDRQAAALDQAVAQGDFNGLIGASLGLGNILAAGLPLATRNANRGQRKYAVVRPRIKLGIEGIDTATHPAFAEYRRLNKDRTDYLDNPKNKSSDSYGAENIARSRATGLEFQRAVLGLIDPSKFTVVSSPRLRVPGVEGYAVPDGRVISHRDGFELTVEVKSTNLTDPKALPDLSHRQETIYPAAAAQGRSVIVIFQRNNKIVVMQIAGGTP